MWTAKRVRGERSLTAGVTYGRVDRQTIVKEMLTAGVACKLMGRQTIGGGGASDCWCCRWTYAQAGECVGSGG